MNGKTLTIGLMAVLGLSGVSRAQSEAKPAPPDLDVLVAPQPEGQPEEQLRIERLPGPKDEGRLYWRVTKSPRRTAGYLGVAVSAAPPALSHQLRLAEGVGLVVEQVIPGSPAQKAGIQQYDLLVKLNDQMLINPEQLATLVQTYRDGKEVTLELIREGERQTLSAKLSSNPAQPMFNFTQPNPPGQPNRLRLRFAPPQGGQPELNYRPVPPQQQEPKFQRDGDPQPQYRIVPTEPKPAKKAKPHQEEDQEDQEQGE
jgi:membrane-associated protease RseP (regulator of RpoE activity)